MCSSLTGVPPDELADVESTEIGPRWLPQTFYLFKVSSSLNSPTTTAGAKLTWSRQSLCVVNDQPVGNPKRKV
jgi:hypothetical protein